MRGIKFRAWYEMNSACDFTLNEKQDSPRGNMMVRFVRSVERSSNKKRQDSSCLRQGNYNTRGGVL